MTLRVVVTDLETGDVGERDVEAGDYFLVCHDPCRLDDVQVLDGGATHLVTIKDRTP